MALTFFRKAKKNAATPKGKRLYAIGDIHGCADLLNMLIDKLDRDGAQDENARLIFLGDYVDRGPDSKGVINRLIDLQRARPDTVFLKGNHEAAMLEYIADPAQMPGWLDWGGEETLASYGVDGVRERDGKDVAAELARKTPRAHIGFLRSLSLMHVEADYVFVHAGVKPGVPLEDQVEEDLLWIRKEFHDTPSRKRPDEVIIHGHHPTKGPVDHGWRIGIDTGACWTDRLTAVVLDGEERRFIST